MKLLFTDLDGTLLTDDKTILDIDMKALEEMLKCGHKLVLCTGRPHPGGIGQVHHGRGP